MTYDFAVSDVIAATPQAIYEAWMTSLGHSAMTGAEAKIDERLGEPYYAWDGYITGRTLVLEPNHRIVQSWRTAEFVEADSDSQIDVLLEPVESGTKITIHHTNVPDGHLGYEQGGWQESYFDPMKRFFATN